MSTSLIIPVDESSLAKIEAIAHECSPEVMSTLGNLQRAFRMAAGIRALREAITPPMVKELLALQGTSLGFRTDKDAGQGYPAEIVKECAIEAAMRGALWIGNEFNIISGRTYMTKEFFTRKLSEFVGLADLKLSPGVPQVMGEKGALVPYTASWVLYGRPDSIECKLSKAPDGTEVDERICVRVNSGMGADAILGKAERKIKARIYARITGCQVWDGEIDDSGNPVRRPANTLDSLTERLNGNGSNGNGNGIGHTDRVSFEESVRSRFEACGSPEELNAAEREMANQANSDADAAMVSGLAEQFAAKFAKETKGKGQKQLV